MHCESYIFRVVNVKPKTKLNVYLIFDVSPLRVYRSLLFDLNIRDEPDIVNELVDFIREGLGSTDILIQDKQPYTSSGTLIRVSKICHGKNCRLFPLSKSVIDFNQKIPEISWELIEPWFSTRNLKISVAECVSRFLRSDPQVDFEEKVVRSELLILFVLEYQFLRNLLADADIYKTNILSIFNDYKREELINMVSKLHNQKHIDNNLKNDIEKIKKTFFGKKYEECKWKL